MSTSAPAPGGAAPRLAVRCVVALDRLCDRARPLVVVDPVHMANDVLVTMDRLGQGNVQQLALRFLALAALRGPTSALASDDQRLSLRGIGRPLVHVRTCLSASRHDSYARA